MVAGLLLCSVGAVAEIEDRALAREPVGLLLLPVGERLLEHLDHALARARAARRT